MNSPNLMAACAAQRTKRVKLLIYGNLLPLHEPLRLAEELAMLDCLSNGRMISGFARGIPREYQVHNVALSESRARFEEAYDIVTRAWTEDVFSYQGKFWSYRDVALWPRPVQRPHPEVWMPVVGSKESIEFAAKHNIRITSGLAPGGLQDDIIRYYAQCLAANGYSITPDHLSLGLSVYVADSKAGPGSGGMWALPAVFQSDFVQPRQLHRDQHSAPVRLFDRRVTRLCPPRESPRR
jgi:alkanesulfonate monooxygenase SsuD/methylene tetrahydromethanopterin reductase-like flavin-dependent oxidoreductase (luciferase family)